MLCGDGMEIESEAGSRFILPGRFERYTSMIVDVPPSCTVD